MRGRPFLVAVAVTALVFAARAKGAHADDDLPTGSEPPRIVPMAVVDVYYAYHDSEPSHREATLMTTAVRHNELAMNLASIGAKLEHAKILGTVILQAGTSVDALYPPVDDRTTSSSTDLQKFTGPQVWKHIQEANVGYRFSDVTVEAGIFPSHVGNESFVSTKNWNYTRAMLSDVTPYYLGGVRITAKLAPTLTATVLGYNGWNSAFVEKSNYKSGGFRVEWRPTDTITIADAGHIGPARGSGVRLFDDLVVTMRIFARLSIAAEGWIGADRTSGTEQASPYYAGGLWARFAIGESTYVAGRGEIVVDKDGVLTGSGVRRVFDPLTGERVSPSGQTMMGGALTLGWQPHPVFIARAEALYRTSNQPFFSGGGNSFDPVRKSSTTFSANVAFQY